MNPTSTGIAIMVAGVVMFIFGAIFRTVAARPATDGAEDSVGTEFALAVVAAGVVATLFGTAYLMYSLTAG